MTSRIRSLPDPSGGRKLNLHAVPTLARCAPWHLILLHDAACAWWHGFPCTCQATLALAPAARCWGCTQLRERAHHRHEPAGAPQ